MRPIGEGDVVLQNVVEVDVQEAVVIENGDRPLAVDIRPEACVGKMHMALHAGVLDHGCARASGLTVERGERRPPVLIAARR